eukprot:gene10820-biopygen5260
MARCVIVDGGDGCYVSESWSDAEGTQRDRSGTRLGGLAHGKVPTAILDRWRLDTTHPSQIAENHCCQQERSAGGGKS